MKALVIDDFFVTNIFFPFLLICLGLGIISFFLTFVHYMVCRIEEIREKENSINDTFLKIKSLYKKQLISVEEIANEIYKFKDQYSEYEKNMIEKLLSEKFRNFKKLEKIDNKGKIYGSIKDSLELENIIEYSIQQILAIPAKYPDIKTYSKYLTAYAEYKSLDDNTETIKGVYNRKVKDFNQFLITYPYILFAIVFKIEPRQLF